MKTFKTILIVFLSLSTLAGCKNDDDGIDPTLDTDGDGVPDIDDLCPNEVGTFIDDGCFLVTNVNLEGDHAINFLESEGTISATVAGVQVNGTVTAVGDTFQLTASFRENGTVILNGQYRVVTTIVLGGEVIEDAEILVYDNEAATYTTDSDAETITFSGTDEFDETWDATLFNQAQLTITTMSTETTDDGATIQVTTEIRMSRI